MLRQKKEKFPIFIVFVVFISTVSQLPLFVELQITQIIAAPLWIIVALYVLPKFEINKISGWFVLIISFLALYTFTLDAFTLLDYGSIQLIYPFYLSVFIFFIGVNASGELNYEIIYNLLIAYLIATIIISISIYMKFFLGGVNLNGSQYAYATKNSVSQIIFTGLVILVFIFKPQKKLYKLSKVVILIFLILNILFLRSRATIIALPLIVIIPFLFTKVRLRSKIIFFVASSFFILVVFTNKYIYNVFVNGILAGGRDINDLNALSSGRLQELFFFSKTIYGNELWGIGKVKIESFPLSVMLQYGIPVGLIFISIAIWPFWWGVRYLNKTSHLNILFIIISLAYFINGLFEQLAPFGPGVKNFILWLLFGIMYGKRKDLYNDYN